MITLEDIKRQQDRITSMIAEFEAANNEQHIRIEAANITLHAGERYAGIILNEAGQPGYHLILLPDEVDEIIWSDAVCWADDIGGILPNRQEQALLYATLKDQFKNACYWSYTQHASYADCALCQYFDNGNQKYQFKANKRRARAVRRVAI